MMGAASNLLEMRTASNQLKSLYEPYCTGEKTWIPPDSCPEVAKLPFPPYICQPYVRPPKPPQESERDDDASSEQPIKKPRLTLPESILSSLPPGFQLSNNKIKKMSKKPFKNWALERPPLVICTNCVNPQGGKCEYSMCKKCCREKCIRDILDCVGHKTLTKTFREHAKLKRNEHQSNGEQRLSVEGVIINGCENIDTKS
jgi:hypothetical protein